MSLFKSRFAKLEAYVGTKAEDRTADQLKAVQAELDAAGAKVVLVPHSESITSPEQLDKHIETLETKAKEAQAAEATAKAEQEKATKALAELRGTRVVDDARQTSDKKAGGDQPDGTTAEAEAQKVINDSEAPWNATADRMGFTLEQATPNK